MLNRIRVIGLSTAAGVLILGLGLLVTFIVFRLVDSVPSFLVGFAGVFGLLLIGGMFYLASHSITGKWPGTFIGFGTAILMLVVSTIWRPFDDLQGSSFWFGLLCLAIVAVASATVYGATWLANRINNRITPTP